MKTPSPYHDFHGLGRLDFRRPRCIVLHGVGGAGKSTAIQWLQERSREVSFQVIDEVRTVPELRAALQKIDPSRSILIASHLPRGVHRVVRPWRMPQHCFVVDRNRGQIEAWLADREIDASPGAIDRFVKCYRASFVDLRIVVEAFPSHCFDHSLHQFEKQRTIVRTPGLSTP